RSGVRGPLSRPAPERGPHGGVGLLELVAVLPAVGEVHRPTAVRVARLAAGGFHHPVDRHKLRHDHAPHLALLRSLSDNETVPASRTHRFLAYGFGGWAVDSLWRRRPSSLLNVPVYGLAQPLFEPVHDRLRHHRLAV